MKNTKALTLIEVTLAMSLTALIIGSVYLALNQGLNSWRKGTKRVQLLQQAQNTLNRIVEELRYATSDVNITAGGISFDTKLVENTDENEENINYIWSLGTGELRRSVNSGTNYLFANNVTVFSTSRTDDIVTVTITLEDTTNSDNITVSLSSTAYLRNI